MYYLEIDAASVVLARERSYIRAADHMLAVRYAVRATIPPRSGTTVYGISFIASRVLHSGADGVHGHFVAAYGYDRGSGIPSPLPR